MTRVIQKKKIPFPYKYKPETNKIIHKIASQHVLV